MFVQNLVLSCWNCLNGHRASHCAHEDRPLYALKNKGRPRPGTERAKGKPDMTSLHDGTFARFHETVMNDPGLYRQYFHERPPSPVAGKPVRRGSNSSSGKRNAPYTVRDRPGCSDGEVYWGKCSDEQRDRWKELCGIVGLTLQGRKGDWENVPTWPLALAVGPPVPGEEPIVEAFLTWPAFSEPEPPTTFTVFCPPVEMFGPPPPAPGPMEGCVNPGYLSSTDLFPFDLADTQVPVLDPAMALELAAAASAETMAWALKSLVTSDPVLAEAVEAPSYTQDTAAIDFDEFLNESAFEDDVDELEYLFTDNNVPVSFR
jgi:hypothetical protein